MRFAFIQFFDYSAISTVIISTFMLYLLIFRINGEIIFDLLFNLGCSFAELEETVIEFFDKLSALLY